MVLPAWPEACLRCGPCRKIVELAQSVVLEVDEKGLQITNKRFDQGMCVCILLNMLALSLDHYDSETGDPEELLAVIDSINLAFTGVFLVEMTIKILALGVRRYLSEAMNVLDAFSVITGLMEKSLTSLRAIRFLRLIRLAKFLKSMQQVIAVLTKAWKSILYITGLLILFIFIFTMAGMQLFGGKLTEEDGSIPRNNFDSFHWATVSVFQVLAGENWPALLFAGIRSVGWATAVPYYVSWVVIGQYVVLNLFLAVVMAYFDELSSMGDSTKPSAFRKVFSELAPDGASTITYEKFEELFGPRPAADVESGGEKSTEEPPWPGLTAHTEAIGLLYDRLESEPGEGKPTENHLSPPDKRRASLRDVREMLLTGMDLNVDAQLVQRCFIEADADDEAEGLDADGFVQLLDTLLQSDPPVQPAPACWHRFNQLSDDGSGRLACDQVVALLYEMGLRAEPEPASLVPETADGPAPGEGRMLCCIPTGSCLHRGCTALVHWPWFDRAVLALICLSSITLAMDRPDLPDATVDMLYYSDVVFTALFSVEVVVKLVTYGVVLHPGAYFRSTWNVLDFVVVAASITNIAASQLEISWLKAFRMLRALRPLRMVSRNEGMKIICNALLLSLRTIANVGVVLCFVWFMFALMGVQLFKGKMYHCSDPDFPPGAPRFGLANSSAGNSSDFSWTVEPCTPEFGRTWQRDDVNFDNLPRALLSLYIFSSGEAWPDVMFAASDIVGVDHQPARDSSPLAAYFFVIYMALTSFFFVEMFVGAIFQRFIALKREVARDGGKFLLTPAQEEWISAQRKLLHKLPEKPPIPPQLHHGSCGWVCGGACARCVNSVLRMLNAVVCSPSFEKFIVGCIVLNTLVMAASFYGEPEWWTDVLATSNSVLTAVFVAEAVLKLGGLGLLYFRERWNWFDFFLVVGSLVDQLGGDFINTALFRVFRIARAIRLARNLKGLRKITQTLWLSLPALVNVGTLLFLLLFVYAVLGVSLFAVPAASDWPEGLDRHANFDDWGSAMLLLLRTMTGEDWQVVMFGCSTLASPVAVWLFFGSYVFLASFVTINLFVMIIADNFDQDTELTTAATDAASDLSRLFKEAWAELDPFATRYIKRSKMQALISLLWPELKKERWNSRLDADGDGTVSAEEAADYESRLELHYWRIPSTKSDDNLGQEDGGEGEEEEEEEWVHFSEVLGRLHAVAFAELQAQLPPTALETLPTRPSAIRQRIEEETAKRSKKLLRQASPTSASPRRKKKRELLSMLSSASAATPRPSPLGSGAPHSSSAQP